jgi:hypothetical protein
MCIQKCTLEVQTPPQKNLTGHSMTTQPSVITQQYSSTIFVSLLFHFLEGKIWHVSKISLFQNFFFLKN